MHPDHRLNRVFSLLRTRRALVESARVASACVARARLARARVGGAFAARVYVTSALVASALAASVFLGACATPRPAVTEATPSSDHPRDVRQSARLAERHFTDGSLLEMRERHAEAIAEYRRALELDSSRGSIYYAIGKNFRRLDQIDSAILYTRMAADRGGALEVYEQLADLMMLSGDIDGAIAQYDSMLTIEPDHLQSRYMAARLLQRREPARAIEHYEYILRNLTDDTDVMLRLAELYLDAGNVDGAIGMMTTMRSLEPTNPDLHHMMATLLLDAGRYAAALEVLTSAEEHVAIGAPLEEFYGESLRDVADRLDEGHGADDSVRIYAAALVARASASAQSPGVRLLAGGVAIAIGDSARAEALFARSIADSSSSAQAWIQVAGTYLELNDPATGLRVVGPETGRFADDYRVPLMLGLLHEAAGAPDTAIAWIRRSVELYDEQAEAWAALGRIYAATGKVGASDAAYEKSIGIDPENATVLNNFAYALARRGSRLERALELVTKALEYEPENESFLDTRGWVHFRRGELDAALADLEKAAAAGGASAEIYEHLGDVHKARGAYIDARRAYERAAELEPERDGLEARLRSVR